MSTDGPSGPEPPKPPLPPGNAQPPSFDRNDLVSQVLQGALSALLAAGKPKETVKEALAPIRGLLYLAALDDGKFEKKDADALFDYYAGRCMMVRRMIPLPEFKQHIQRVVQDPKADAATVDLLVRWLMHAAKH